MCGVKGAVLIRAGLGEYLHMKIAWRSATRQAGAVAAGI